MELTEIQNERYCRSMMCDGFSQAEQAKLLAASVLVVGAGGLGSAVLSYLVAAGVGRIGIVEFDNVSLSNLQRQILYTTSDIGTLKVEAAKNRLEKINPDIKIECFAEPLCGDNAKNILSGYDLAVDCTDNFEVRAVLDSACAEAGKAMVYGTAQNWGGQVATFNWGRAGRYVDMFGQGEQLNTVGVISPVVGVIGSLQAVEVIRILTSVGDTLDGKLVVFNCLDNKFNVYTL